MRRDCGLSGRILGVHIAIVSWKHEWCIVASYGYVFCKKWRFYHVFHNFTKMGITIFPKAPGGCGSCVEIGTGSDPLPAVADRLAYLWNRKAAIPAIGHPQKKRWKSAILQVDLGFWRCCNSGFFGSSSPSQAIESGDFEVVFTISGTLPSGTQQAACFGIRISWKMERFCGDIWWEYLGILYIWWNIVWETSWDIDRTGWKMATLAGVTWNFNGL